MDLLLNNIEANLAIAVAIGVVMSALRVSLGAYAEHNIFVRIQPWLPAGLGALMAWFAVDGSAVSRIALGICLGAISGLAYKILQQTFRGRDKRIGS